MQSRDLGGWCEVIERGALRNARLDENQRQNHDDPTTRRLVSDSGTVRRYESTSIDTADDDGDRGVTTGSRYALRTGSSSASPPPSTPPARSSPAPRSITRAGAAVAIADVNKDGAETAAEAMRKQGARALAVGVYVADPDSVRAMVAAVVDAFGRVDIINDVADAEARN